MRWRFVDKILGFEEWKSIRCRKAISLEEYYLLEPLGRKGVLPENLVLECCVEAVRWLVAGSTQFINTSMLAEVESFRFNNQAKAGNVLEIGINISEYTDQYVSAECSVKTEGGSIASGRLVCDLAALNDIFDPDYVKSLWREIYGAS